MADETIQEDVPETACKPDNVKVLYIGNLSQGITNKSLQDYLHNATNDFVRLQTLQPSSKRTKFAFAAFVNHSAAAEALLVLQDKPLGPKNAPIVVDFKKTKASRQSTNNENKKQQLQKKGVSGTSKNSETPSGESSNIHAKAPGDECSRRSLNTDAKQLSKTSEDFRQSSKSVGANHPDVSNNTFADSTTKCYENRGKQRSKSKKDGAVNGNRNAARSCDTKSTSFQSNTRPLPTFESSSEKLSLNAASNVLHSFPASQRFIEETQDFSSPQVERPAEKLRKNTKTSSNSSDNNLKRQAAVLSNQRINQEQANFPGTAAFSSRMVTGKATILPGEPSRILHITGKDGEGVDQARLYEFVQRNLPDSPTLWYENDERDAKIEFTNVFYAEHAYGILVDRPLSISGAPINVKYAPSAETVAAYTYDNDKECEIKTFEMPSEQESNRDHNDHNEKDRILRITSKDNKLERASFQKMLNRYDITYEHLDVHYPQEQMYGTLALIEFGSYEEALEAKRKINDCRMGEPPGEINTQITSRRKRNRRRRKTKRPAKSITALTVSTSSERSEIVEVINAESKDDDSQYHNAEYEPEPDIHDDTDGSCSEESHIEPLNLQSTSTSVLVTNIDNSIDRKHIQSFLTENDIDTRGLHFFHSSGKCGSYAVVRFQYPEEAYDAWKILKEQPLGIFGDKIHVTFIRKSEQATADKTKCLKRGDTKANIPRTIQSAALSPNPTGEKQKQNRATTVNPIEGLKGKASKTLSPNDVIIDDLPNDISESDIAEVVWKCPDEVRSGFINSELTCNKAVLTFKSQASAFEAVAELHFIRVKGHVLNGRLAVPNPDFDLLMFRKQREVLATHIKDIEKNVNNEMETKMNELAVQIAEIDNDLVLCDNYREAEMLEATRDTLLHKLDENQRFFEQFKQTAQDMRQELEELVLDESEDKQRILSRLDGLCRRLEREGRRTRNPLPIYGSKTHILQVVTDPSTQACVIKAETGSGKSTQVPQYLIEMIPTRDNLSTNKQGIICTQPRRVAAVTLAKRIAEEYGCKIGQEVGFIAGNRKKVSRQTLATFMTDRALLNCCLSDSDYLENYKYVIIDEAHERSVDTDILIAMLKKEQQQQMRDIKIIIMSATIDVDMFSRYFDGCPVVDIPGRTFPVDVEWCEGSMAEQNAESDNYLSNAVQKSCDIHRNEDIPGDILVFLTSQNEIDRACNDLKRMLGIKATEDTEENVEILPLHGKLQPHDQFKVFKKTREGKRKIVFATNIAETSVTIPGIKYVVDTGMVKELQYDAQKNMSMLKITSVTQASAEQRKGRAGRTGPGTCYRLYSKDMYKDMEPTMKPEILRVHLGMALIQLLQMEVHDIEHFDFVESPEPGAIEHAMKTLILLGAVKDMFKGKILTDLGYQMSKLSLEPRLAKLILEGAKRDRLKDAIAMAALISAPGNVYYQGGGDAERKQSDQLKLKFCVEDGDVITLLSIYKEWYAIKGDKARNKWCKENSFNAKTLRLVQENVEELDLIIKRSKVIGNQNGSKQDIIKKTRKDTKCANETQRLSEKTNKSGTEAKFASYQNVKNDAGRNKIALSNAKDNDREQVLRPEPSLCLIADDMKSSISQPHTATFAINVLNGTDTPLTTKTMHNRTDVNEICLPTSEPPNDLGVNGEVYGSDIMEKNQKAEEACNVELSRKFALVDNDFEKSDPQSVSPPFPGQDASTATTKTCSPSLEPQNKLRVTGEDYERDIREENPKTEETCNVELVRKFASVDALVDSYLPSSETPNDLGVNGEDYESDFKEEEENPKAEETCSVEFSRKVALVDASDSDKPDAQSVSPPLSNQGSTTTTTKMCLPSSEPQNGLPVNGEVYGIDIRENNPKAEKELGVDLSCRREVALVDASDFDKPDTQSVSPFLPDQGASTTSIKNLLPLSEPQNNYLLRVNGEDYESDLRVENPKADEDPGIKDNARNDSYDSEMFNSVTDVKQDSVLQTNINACEDPLDDTPTVKPVSTVEHAVSDQNREENNPQNAQSEYNKHTADDTQTGGDIEDLASRNTAEVQDTDVYKRETFETNLDNSLSEGSQQPVKGTSDPNEILRKILMASYFENLSVFSGHIRAGYIVASQLKTAVFHPSSALVALNSRPKWVIYGELRRTSRDFLCVVTPVAIEWINEVAPVEFSQHIDLENVKTCIMTEVKFDAIGTAIMKTLSKRRFECVRNLEDDITRKAGAPCIIEANANDGSMAVFIANHSKFLAEEIVKKSLEDIKIKSRREQTEISVGEHGSVRQVVISGGETSYVLMNDDEYMSVEWSGISDDISEEVLRQCLETIDFVPEDIVDVLKFPKHWNVAKQGKWGKVTFASPEKARQAVNLGFMIDPYRDISIQPVLPYVRKKCPGVGTQPSASINIKSLATWYTGRSKGHAFVDCETEAVAREVINDVDFSWLRGKCIRCKLGRKKHTSVFITQLDTDVTPEELEEHIEKKTSASIQKVFIPRVKAIGCSDASYKAELRRIFRHVSKEVEVNVLRAKGLKRKAFITFEPNLGATKRRQLKELTQRSHRSASDELFRMTVIITCDLFCSQRVYNSMREEIAREIRTSECKVVIADAVKIPSDKKIHITFNEYDEVEHLKRKLQVLLCAEEISASSLIADEVSPTWIDKVLNRLTDRHLEDILKKNRAHIDVHIRRQTFQLYGRDIDRKTLKSELRKYMTFAATTMFREVDIAGRSGGQKGRAMRALVRQYGPWLEQLKVIAGVDDITIDMKRGLLFVDGSEEAYASLLNKVDDSLKGLASYCGAGKLEVEGEECGVCFCPPSEADSKPYRLAACGHFFCIACLKHHLKQSGIAKKFPICCPECEESIMLCDIKTIYPKEDEQNNLFEAGLNAHIAQKPGGDIKFCPGPDCCMVYRKDEDGGTQECDECGYRFCTGCGEKPHPEDMSCKEFRVSQKKFDDIETWMRQSGVDAKKCPVCKIVIEKNDGCNHMTCRNCKSDICWICSKVFESANLCYSHLLDEHGGINDVPNDIPARQDAQYRVQPAQNIRRQQPAQNPRRPQPARDIRRLQAAQVMQLPQPAQEVRRPQPAQVMRLPQHAQEVRRLQPAQDMHRSTSVRDERWHFAPRHLPQQEVQRNEEKSSRKCIIL